MVWPDILWFHLQVEQIHREGQLNQTHAPGERVQLSLFGNRTSVPAMGSAAVLGCELWRRPAARPHRRTGTVLELAAEDGRTTRHAEIPEMHPVSYLVCKTHGSLIGVYANCTIFLVRFPCLSPCEKLQPALN
jgi:hypothetical protein